MPLAAPLRRPTFAVFAVLVLAGAGCIAKNAEDTPRAETAMTLIDVVQDESGGARVSWDDHPRGLLSEFAVLRDGKRIATVAAPARSYVDRDVAPGRAYAYAVQGFYPSGEAGPTSAEASFTLRRELALVQDQPLGRGYVNLTVLSRSPGLRWDDLRVYLDGEAVPASGSGVLAQGTWAHSDVDDALVDLGEKLSLLDPARVKRNATLRVGLADGTALLGVRLDGRPTVNLTLEQERNATQGRVVLLVRAIGWTDGVKRVSPADDTLRARWSDLAVLLNGTRLRLDPAGGPQSWSHDVPQDDVVRVGERLTVRHELLTGRGARIEVVDDVAGGASFDLIVR